MKRKTPQSVVFLTEILLALMIFALCSSVCAGLFALSDRISKDSGVLGHAVIAAHNGAEAFKTKTSLAGISQALGGFAWADGGGCTVRYGADWKPVTEDAVYEMQIGLTQDAVLRYADVLVLDGDGRVLFRLGASALVKEGTP